MRSTDGGRSTSDGFLGPEVQLIGLHLGELDEKLAKEGLWSWSVAGRVGRACRWAGWHSYLMLLGAAWVSVVFGQVSSIPLLFHVFQGCFILEMFIHKCLQDLDCDLIADEDGEVASHLKILVALLNTEYATKQSWGPGHRFRIRPPLVWCVFAPDKPLKQPDLTEGPQVFEAA